MEHVVIPATGDTSRVTSDRWPASASASPRRWLALGLKVVVSAALIYWVLHSADVGSILGFMASADLRLVGLAVLLSILGHYLSVWRWRILLQAHGFHPGQLFLFRSYMVGLFFNNLLPGTVGGDVVRGYDTWQAGLGRGAAVAVLIVDRFLGLLSLVALATIGVLAFPWTIASFKALWIVVAGMAVASLLLSYAVFSPRARVLDRLAKSGLATHPAVASLLNRVRAAFAPFQGHWSSLGGAFLFSMLLQLNVVLSAVVLTRALGLDIPIAPLVVIVPLSLLAMSIPISINAIGIRENVYVFFFAAFGIASEGALAFAWLAYAVLLSQAILGGLVYMTRR